MEKQSLAFFAPLLTLIMLTGCKLPKMESCTNCPSHKKVVSKNNAQAADVEIQKLDSTAAFEELIVSAKKPVVIKFTAPWCGACQEMTPILKDAVKQAAGKYIFAEVNIDTAKDLAATFHIKGIPTICLFKNGQEIAKNKRQVGVVSAAALLTFIATNID